MLCSFVAVVQHGLCFQYVLTLQKVSARTVHHTLITVDTAKLIIMEATL